MSKKEKRRSVKMVPLNKQMLSRFYRLAPSVLESRGGKFFWREIEFGFQIILMGIVPIVGVTFWDWSPINWLVFLIVGALVGFVCDLIKSFSLGNEIRAYAKTRADCFFVGAVCDALKRGEKKVPEPYVNTYTDPTSVGISIDLVFGTVAIGAIFMVMSEDNQWAKFESRYFLLSVISITAYQLVMTFWEIVDQKINRDIDAPVKVFLGLRGACLFILMFIVFMSRDWATDGNASKVMIYVVNGLLIGIGLLSIYGICSMMAETKWLKKHLKSKTEKSNAI